MKSLFSFSTVCLFIVALSISGCGIKPDELSPPEGSESNGFPQTYPDPATDPK